MKILLVILFLLMWAVLLLKEVDFIYRFMVSHRPRWLAFFLAILMGLGTVDAGLKGYFFDACWGFFWFLWLFPPFYNHILDNLIIKPVKERWQIHLEPYILIFLVGLYFAGGQGLAKLSLWLTTHKFW
ncbi:hypothetical protein K4A83_15760 [Spirulina subsalsa FACHB-351]|uniref:Uncharacterized protein n=1 Tax=Spirulina subsalsa FACHB-351 TaxID=234711 RepID=A0ABT3L881_9CYAN|nr:hypothetical protein [Spirulina subsalsa]MCW6037716.1 hypothetical protein [Spirulina subsalsa FACHB-351]